MADVCFCSSEIIKGFQLVNQAYIHEQFTIHSEIKIKEEGANSIMMSHQTADPLRNNLTFWEIHFVFAVR